MRIANIALLIVFLFSAVAVVVLSDYDRPVSANDYGCRPGYWDPVGDILVICPNGLEYRRTRDACATSPTTQRCCQYHVYNAYCAGTNTYAGAAYSFQYAAGPSLFCAYGGCVNA